MLEEEEDKEENEEEGEEDEGEHYAQTSNASGLS
jgi:hypothetical protein